MKGLLVLLSFLAAAAASAQQYKWIDQDGKVRYGDTPPPGVKATPLRPPSGPAPAASAKPAEKGEKALSPEAAYRKRQEEMAKEREKQAQNEAQTQAKRDNCARAQESLRTLESGQRISRTDAKGERYYLEDAQIAQEAARARQIVQQECG